MKKILSITLVFIFLSYSRAFPWDPYDRVIAVVNSISIIESEIRNKFNHIKKIKRIPGRKLNYEKSRVLDKYIEDALVYETAVNESIIINNARVLSSIEKLLKQYFISKVGKKNNFEQLMSKLLLNIEKKINNEKTSGNRKLNSMMNTFIRYIEAKHKLKFADFFEEIRLQIRREQVMSIAIGVSPPAKKKVMKWYKNNRKKLGYEIKIKHILIIPLKRSLTGEKKAYQTISALKKRILSGQSFEKIARQYSRDPMTAVKGGDMGWVMLAELDPYFAGNVYKMNRVGQISKVFKSSFGYHIVKYLGKRPVTFEKVEKLITYKLYNEKMLYQFKKWIVRRKFESDIKIFMKNYIKTKG